MRKLAIAAGMVVAILASSVPAVSADERAIWGGACTITVNFDFHDFVNPLLTTPNYDVSASGSTCTSSAAPGSIVTTSAGGQGQSILWTCDLTFAEGSWSQNWSSGPPEVDGTHFITGSNGVYTMIFLRDDLSFGGLATLVVSPSDATKLVSCNGVVGINSLSLTGQMVFWDP